MPEEILQNIDVLVKDNIRIISLPAKRFKKPIAIILVGPPFSGKSALVDRLSKAFPLAILSEDRMREFLAPRATFFKRGAPEIFLLASKTMEALLKDGISCIYDATIKKRADREFLRNLMSAAGGRMALIYIDIPEEEAYKVITKVNAQVVRGDSRGFVMDKDFFRYELNSTERPLPDEQPIVVNTLHEWEKERVENHIRGYLQE